MGNSDDVVGRPSKAAAGFQAGPGGAWKPRAALESRPTVIPAHPLALTAAPKLDERRQRALTRYYLAAGAGGIAVGVHTTQFAIRDPKVGLFEPVLTLAMEELRGSGAVAIAGICGR